MKRRRREYWKSRLRRHGEIPGRWTKIQTHRKERRVAKHTTRKEFAIMIEEDIEPTEVEPLTEVERAWFSKWVALTAAQCMVEALAEITSDVDLNSLSRYDRAKIRGARFAARKLRVKIASMTTEHMLAAPKVFGIK